MTVYINDVSVIAPGLTDKEKTRLILSGDDAWSFENMPPLKPEMLPANERRRTTNLIKLALECMQHVLKDSDDLNTVSTVFASSDGDLGIVDKLCSALATEDKMVSPTLFHNSVHNAPAGYWSIAASMKGPSTSISAADATFMSGLQDAVAQVEIEGGSVLFVAYDYPAPPLLDHCRHFGHPLAIALRIGDTAEHKVLGTIDLKGRIVDAEVSVCRNKSLEVLRAATPVGCGLPLVEALIRRARMQVNLPYLRGEVFQVVVSH